jgi:mono/diheme cytochrome c family protein/glucose/arabinose dehydrogenase
MKFSSRRLVFLAALILAANSPSPAFAQSGDRGSTEKQIPRVPKEKIPPAPPLPPNEAIKSFKLPPGFRIEIVASEPMVETPIAMQWDADGRIWVVEMRGFMPNPDGVGETEPVGRISVLEDTDGDGRMDKKTVFLDNLVMPRALCLAYGGVLVCAPPALTFYPIESGLKPGAPVVVIKDYATAGDPSRGKGMNPEHTANSPTWMLDNWIYSANSSWRIRRIDGEWKKLPAITRGQWGLTQDNFGRMFFNSNSDHLRTDTLPAEYLVRNPFYRSATLSVQPLKDQSVWPSRVNPGVNRGYQEKQLRPDGTLATYTAACGPGIYRGDNFPSEYLGSAFACEPSGNLVRCEFLAEKDASITGRNPFDKTEFLTSTDEIFRPVNAYTGPDGALYLVDMYHGILQHRVFLTSYLRKQAEDRGLDKVIRHGRIWRVAHSAKPLSPKPQLAKASGPELVTALSHPNGWWRDTAQRLLVERTPADAIPLLKQAVITGATPLARLHALWSLDGVGRLDSATVNAALEKEKHPKVLAAAVRCAEPMLKTAEKDTVLPKLAALATKAPIEAQIQLALTLGHAFDPAAEKAIARIATAHAGNSVVRDALLSSLGGRELELARILTAEQSWQSRSGEKEQFLGALARCVTTQARSERVNQLLAVIGASTTPAWQQSALIAGMTPVPTGTKKGSPPPRVKLIRLPAEPPAFAALRKLNDKSVSQALSKLDPIVVWPGKPGAPVEKPVRPLDADEQARFTSGKALYELTCAACHQLHGMGQDGVAPPLVDSEWVAGKPDRLARIILHGVRGQISVLGKKYDLEMPALGGTFDDEQLAALITYVRREWDNPYDPVTKTAMAKVRLETAQRQDAWSEAELLKVK